MPAKPVNIYHSLTRLAAACQFPTTKLTDKFAFNLKNATFDKILAYQTQPHQTNIYTVIHVAVPADYTTEDYI